MGKIYLGATLIYDSEGGAGPPATDPGFTMDREISLDAADYERTDNSYDPESLVTPSYASEAAPAGQKWTAGGYNRTPEWVANFPNQLIFDPYSTAELSLYLSTK